MSEFVQPNLHIALVHFPIALICIGVGAEVFSFLGWRKSSVRLAARWMILLGAVLGMATATSGIYALADLREFVADDLIFNIQRHLVLGGAGVLITLLVCTAWIGMSDDWRRKLHVPMAIALLLATAAILAGSHFGGELVYESGLGVRQQGLDEASGDGWRAKLLAVAPPTQVHVIFAGLAFAMAILAPGIASRAMRQRADTINPFDPHSTETYSEPAVTPAAPTERTRGFGVVTFLVTLLAALAGFWILAGEDSWRPSALWHAITDRQMNSGRWLTRLLAHLIVGASLLLLPVALLLFARWLPRARALWLILSTLLAIAIAAQVWLGVLLLFDGSLGGVTKWNAP